MIFIINGVTFNDNDNVVLVLESHVQDQDLNKYRCTAKKSQLRALQIVYHLVDSDNNDQSNKNNKDASAVKVNSNDMEVRTITIL